MTLVAADEFVDDAVDAALAVDQLQDFDGLLVGQQEPLGREHDPRLPHLVKAELCMRRKAQDGIALDP